MRGRLPRVCYSRCNSLDTLHVEAMLQGVADGERLCQAGLIVREQAVLQPSPTARNALSTEARSDVTACASSCHADAFEAASPVICVFAAATRLNGGLTRWLPRRHQISKRRPRLFEKSHALNED